MRPVWRYLLPPSRQRRPVVNVPAMHQPGQAAGRTAGQGVRGVTGSRQGKLDYRHSQGMTLAVCCQP